MEEIVAKDILVPCLDESSIHPFSLVDERKIDVFKGVEIIFCVAKKVRNHIDDDEWRIIGVLENIEINLEFVINQAVVKPIKITRGVKIFWEKGIIRGWLGLIRIQFNALPPKIAAKVIRNIGAIIGRSLSVRLEQGIECFGAHKIIIIIRREYPAVSPVAKKAIKKIKEFD
ncbi:MAG: hypothetical protein FE835_19500 [Gammaproteobacteria bacterium]|nr:hypothetical protein [Gammaproteobacteria bacterium]